MSASKQLMNVVAGWLLWSFLSCLSARAQTTASITTLPLEVSAVCPGSVIAVPFTYTGVVGKVAVQISNGQSFSTIYTESKSFLNVSSNLQQLYARLADTIQSNQTYQVRVISTDGSIFGSISPTQLTIRAGVKPPKPIVDSLNQVCERVSANDYYSQINIKLVPNATFNVYRDDFSTDFPTNGYHQFYSRSNEPYAYIEVGKGFNVGPCTYPLSQSNFYFTQTVAGCESDKAKTIYRVLCRDEAFTFKEPIYSSGPPFARIRYCQGDIPLPLDKKGYTPSNPNLYVLFETQALGWASRTTVIPTPSTDKPGSTVYELLSVPYDNDKICSHYVYPSALEVVVDPRPGIPVVINPVLTYYQNQTALAISAMASSTATSLRWYLPDPTGPGSFTTATAPVPPTDKPGSFTYLVSQIQDNCESPRYPVTVNVLAPLAVEDPTLSDQITVYPVPTAALVMVDLSAVLLRVKPVLLELIEATGRVLWQQETQESKLSVSLQQFPTGTYGLRVKMGDKQVVKRVVKL